MRKNARLCLASLAAISLSASAAADETWTTTGGNLQHQAYSAAGQITPDNVHDLSVAWTLHTGDVAKGARMPHSTWEATPLFVNDTVYVASPFYRLFAVEPDSGKVKWIYDTKSSLLGLTDAGPRTRGPAYWQAAQPVAGQPCQKILFLGTMDAKLHAVDADTGKACTGFARNGVLDIDQWNSTPDKSPFSILQPPTVYKDTLILGWSGKDVTNEAQAPGSVFGVDTRTGKLKWTFVTIPEDMRGRIGTANVWAGISVDPDTGIVYLPVSSPEANFYGGDRKEYMPLVTSVTALDAETGRLIWSRQLVHHDIWDYDTDSAPTLVDIEKDGKKIPALVQSTKQGFLYVLNRMTGEPIYPMIETPVPKSDVPGEQSSPNQPFVPVPEPTVGDHFPGISWIGDVASLGYCSRTYAKLRDDGKFTPPSLGGSIVYPGSVGGVEWGGGAVDPATQTYVVNSSSVVLVEKLIPRAEYNAALKKGIRLGLPQNGTPYAIRTSTFLNPYGMPCWKPPYGTLSSYDLRTGKLNWREPFGQVQKWGFYMPESWGSVTVGGPLITKSGLIFIGASMDSRVRALDLKTGKVLWKAGVEAPAGATPATYTYKGKQYVVFGAGGNSILTPRLSDEAVAFALPD